MTIVYQQESSFKLDEMLALYRASGINRPLDDSGQEVLKHVARLWGFGVHLDSVDGQGTVTKHWSVPAPVNHS